MQPFKKRKQGKMIFLYIVYCPDKLVPSIRKTILQIYHNLKYANLMT